MRILILITALTIALLGTPAMAQDKASIQKLENSFAEAFNKMDAGALANAYSEEAYFLPPNAAMIHGRSGIASFWAQAVQRVGDLKLTTNDVQALGPDAAMEIGSYSEKTKSQPPHELEGKYLVIWRKTAADWKIIADIWNSNKAP